jgi:hypothetical protein
VSFGFPVGIREWQWERNMTQVKAEWLDISFPDFASLHAGYG